MVVIVAAVSFFVAAFVNGVGSDDEADSGSGRRGEVSCCTASFVENEM